MNTLVQTRLKDVVVASRAARRLYALLRRAHASMIAPRRGNLAALASLLRAYRLCGRSEFGAAGRAAMARILARTCYDGAQLRPAAGNALRREFVVSAEAGAMRAAFARFPEDDRVRLRYPRPENDPERQGDLIILKRPDPATGEKGVLLVTYTEAIRRFAAMFDLGALASQYMIVLEPSSWGYEDTTFLFYLGADLDVVVQSPWRRDADFITSLDSNLVASRVGSADWVDPAIFTPNYGPRRYDLAMVSSWHPLKRHNELFEALARLRAQGRKLAVALVGYPAGWTLADIERLMRRHGIDDQCELFEKIPPGEVARILGESRAYLLLSRREGANRALHEALFCNTPVIVYKHHRGVKTDSISEEIGVLFEDGRLDRAILRILDGPATFTPRAWAERNTGWQISTDRINAELKALALRRGLPWTVGIAGKKMAPNLRYADAGRYRDFEAAYQELKAHLIGTAQPSALQTATW